MGTRVGDEPQYERKNSRMIKDILKDALGIARKLLAKNILSTNSLVEYLVGSCSASFPSVPMSVTVQTRLNCYKKSEGKQESS